MTLERIITIATAFDRMGSAVQEQLSDILDDRIGDCNPNAVDRCRAFLKEVKEHADVNGDDELREDTQHAIELIDEYIGV